MKNATVFLISTDEKTSKNLSEQLTGSGQAVSRCKQTFGDIYSEINVTEPEILLLGEWEDSDKTSKIVKKLKDMEKAPEVIIITDKYTPDKTNYLSCGAAGVIPKRTSAAEIISLARRVKRRASQGTEKSTGVSLELELYSRISRILIELGITPRYTGYDYIRDTINQVIHDPYHSKGISKNIYPIIAKMHGINSAGIERSIRTAIEKSWDRIPDETKEKYFGVNLMQFNAHPTNSEYIYILADYISLQLKMEQGKL